ncbi:MAG: methylated-DNA--[protein]-cysteine S-methyltransferase [Proteobacteria bacterium]|nr:methylated-DNA--[protein]-cysteine S-methyltransferase [Pseudomonadota bacterium]
MATKTAAAGGARPALLVRRLEGPTGRPGTACDFARIAAAIRFLSESFRDHPPLAEVARRAGLSPYHFQRLFTRWAGVSPARFARYLSLEFAKRRLEDQASVLDAAYDAGLSGPGRLHDLFVAIEAMTPGDYKAGGEGLRIAFGFHPSPFGEALLLATARGLCGLAFVEPGGRAEALADMSARWPAARFIEDPEASAACARRIFAPGPAGAPLRLHLKGTNFQLRVWEALIRIPPGRVVSYQALARYLGRPDSARAVAGAIAANPVAFVIPCHRVIRASGAVSGYRWGPDRKRAILGWEAVRAEAAQRAMPSTSNMS